MYALLLKFALTLLCLFRSRWMYIRPNSDHRVPYKKRISRGSEEAYKVNFLVISIWQDHDGCWRAASWWISASVAPVFADLPECHADWFWYTKNLIKLLSGHKYAHTTWFRYTCLFLRVSCSNFWVFVYLAAWIIFSSSLYAFGNQPCIARTQNLFLVKMSITNMELWIFE